VEYSIEIWNVKIDDPFLGVLVLDRLEVDGRVENMHVAHAHEDMFRNLASNQLEDIGMGGWFLFFLHVLLLLLVI